MPRVKHCIRLVLVLSLMSVFSTSTVAAQESILPPELEVHKLEARKRFDEAIIKKGRFIREEQKNKKLKREKVFNVALVVSLVALIVGAMIVGASGYLEDEEDD